MFRFCRDTIKDFIRRERPDKFKVDNRKRLPYNAELHSKLIKAVMIGNMDQVVEIISSSSNPRQLINSLDVNGCTALHVAAKFNQLEVAEFLLDRGADCSLIAWSASSPLAMACRYGSESMVEVLLTYKSDPLQKLPEGGNVLHTIALYSTAGVVELNNGANPRAQDVRLITPFMIACRLAYDEVMRTLLFSNMINEEMKTKIMSDVDNEGMTSLHHAVLGGRYEIVLTLLIFEADTNVEDVHSRTPLSLCVAVGNVLLVPLLASYTNDLSLPDNQGNTPLHRAVQLRNKEMIQELLKQKADPNKGDADQTTPLMLACSLGYTEVVRLLFDYEVNIKRRNTYGQTCLHLAIESGHLDVLRILLERCGDKVQQLLHAQDRFGQTVLHEAAKQVNHQFVEELLIRGSSPESKDKEGLLPLHVAACYSGYQTVFRLARVTPDINAKTPDGKTAFYIASGCGNNAAIAALMKLEADVNIIDIHFKNSLMAATIGGHTDIVNDLIQKGVPVTCTDKENNTPLHFACLRGSLAIVKTLLDHGASVSSINIHGLTPLAMAVENSKSEVAVHLMEHTSWEESLSVPYNDGSTILIKMIENTPAAVQTVLDKCVKTTNHPPTHEEYAIEFDYTHINNEQIGMPLSEVVFVTMLDCDRKELILHILCQSNFSYKWHTYGKATFLSHVLLQMGSLISLILFYWVMPGPHTKDYRCVSSSLLALDNTTNNNPFQNVDDRPAFRSERMVAAQAFVYVFMILQFTKDLLTCFAVGLKYTKSWHFTLQMIINLLVILAMVPPGYEPCEIEWRAISYALFIFFPKALVMYQRLSKIGVFITSYFQIARTMFKVSVLMFFIIPAFAIPFSVLINQDGFDPGRQSAFSVFAIVFSEINFRENVILGDNGPFQLDVYLLYPIALLVLTCAMMNLMIAVAAGDVATVLKTAYLSQLRAHIQYLTEAERLLFFLRRRKLLQNKIVIRPNSKYKTVKDKMWRTFVHSEHLSFFAKTEPSSLTQQEQVLTQELADQRATIEKLTKATDELVNALKKNNIISYQTNAAELNTVPTLGPVQTDKVNTFVKERRLTNPT